MAGNQERVGRGLELVGRGLRPYVDRQMTNRYGPGWLAERAERDAERLGRPVRHDLQDTRLLLSLLTEEEFFAEIIPPPGTALAADVIAVGDRLGFRPFQDAEAAQALRLMAQLLRLVGARDLSAEVQGLLLAPRPAQAEDAPVSFEKKDQRGSARPRVAFGRKPKAPAKAPAGTAAEPAAGRWSLERLRLVAMVAAGLALLVIIRVYGSDASPDPHEGAYASLDEGAEIASYEGIELPDGFRLVMLDDPEHPKEGAYRDGGGDLYHQANILTAPDRRLAVLPRGAESSYRACRAAVPGEAVEPGGTDEPSKADLTADQARRGVRFCVTTDEGAVGLFTVTGRGAEPERAVRLDLTVWKGPKPE
ncbi:Swt1 family HEPN domain-containing protein [Actinocorallia populi]|uniref:Swt1 family HEPN domain-containing protein n=1 Tax=Actinocorallia populi TaxID=2079200 RepID=UPI000D08E074|nr:Swt1 family HEPN domain-containing protein [Actinocorallia populi]